MSKYDDLTYELAECQVILDQISDLCANIVTPNSKQKKALERAFVAIENRSDDLRIELKKFCPVCNEKMVNDYIDIGDQNDGMGYQVEDNDTLICPDCGLAQA